MWDIRMRWVDDWSFNIYHYWWNSCTSTPYPSNACSIQNHQYCMSLFWFFPQALTYHIHINFFLATHIVSKIIKLLLINLYQLWIKVCEIAHCTLSGEVSFKDMASLRKEVLEMLNSEDFHQLLRNNFLNIDSYVMNFYE